MQKAHKCKLFRLNFRSVEGDLHVVQECLAPTEDKKISPDISSYAQPGMMQRRATL